MVLRRYTPPTCTLAIEAKESPLSRWTAQPVLKHLRFELHFDDPRQPEAREIILRGDRLQLEALQEAVEIYVQNFLGQSGLGTGKTDALSVNPVEKDLANNSTVKPNPSLLPFAAKSAAGISTLPRGIFLQPKGLLNHELCLGSLSTDESGAVVRLSAIQLFDLATALDEYSAEVIALPSLNRAAGWKAMPAWTRTAAMVLVTVGLTTAAIKLLDKPVKNSETATTAFNQPSASVQSPIAASVAPIPTPSASISPTPLPSQQKLSPPGPVSVPATPSYSPSPILPSATTKTTIPLSPSTPTKSQSRPAPASQPIAALPAPVPKIADLPPAPQLGSPRSPANNSPTASQRSRPETAADAGDGYNPAPATIIVPTGSANSGASNSPREVTTDGSRNRVVDPIPQVAEVRTYFQQRWRSPADLTQALEYNLLLNANGSIGRIIPSNSVSGTYIDRTGMPLIGAPFVSPIQGGATPKIRVILNPDGKVQAALESSR